MQAGIIALGVMLVMRYEASPGSMMGANLLIAKLLLPFEQLIYAWRQWTASLAGWRRVRALLAGADFRDSQAVPAKIEGRLVVDRLRFAPGAGARAILDDISFSLEPGEAVGIVGPSGSGKSTLARLIMGIFPPSGGEARLDGIATYAWDRAEFGRHVGYLPQSIALLDGTILDNIARMRDEEPALAVAAAERVGVHDLIGRLPEGYSTWIGGAGYALSGGQQQRIALARALYGEPKLLVMDEPNSNLDHAGEQSLVQVIAEAKRNGVAVLMITHRPAALAAMDRIVHLNGGRVERIERPSTASDTASAARAIELGASGSLVPA
jgi:ATP-binding cassette subfamily C protein